MTKKKVLWALGVGAVLLGVGAWYAVGVEVPKKSADDDFEIIPTKWSQEGDYAISEVNGRTVVENTAAGFSFMVPEKWEVEREEYIDRFSLELKDPETSVDRNNFRTNGCGINVAAIMQKNDVEYVDVTIKGMEAGLRKSDDERVLIVGGKKALREVQTTEQSPSFSMFGEIQNTSIPVSGTVLLSISTQAMPDDRDRCREDFQNFFESIAFE